ncbi:phage tail sheath family protein [Kitasatospora sp. NPDC056327]|uniref:phage tail sheath family protein n=1 Tax=Kitasatospora sp. NPDC056327 TaxID=3345785 RepID=UPI0035D7E277
MTTGPLAPGVYVDERSSGIRTITAVGTSTPAFLGFAYLDPKIYATDEAKEAEAARRYKPHLVRSWSVFAARYDVDALLKVTPAPDEKEQFLVLAEAVYAFFANGGSACYVVVVPYKVPLTSADLEGDEQNGSGLLGLEQVAEPVSMVAVPSLWTMAGPTDKPDEFDDKKAAALMKTVVAHCVKMKNRLAILDAPPDGRTDEKLLTFAGTLGTTDPDAAFTTLYHPWVWVPGIDGVSRPVPPCGHVAGVWARTDAERGVFKAPANVGLRDALEPVDMLSDARQAVLNGAGVDCLRVFPGRGLLVWGARTLSSSRDWKYLNVRRLVCFLSESIRVSSTWAVFEPNDDRLWASLQHAVASFLTDQWRLGALLGRTPDEAFYVVCDRTNNTDDTIDAGKVICDIGVAPVRPAEFVHFQITQIAGQTGQTG